MRKHLERLHNQYEPMYLVRIRQIHHCLIFLVEETHPVRKKRAVPPNMYGWVLLFSMK